MVTWWKPDGIIPPGDWTLHRLGGASRLIDGAWRTARHNNGAVGVDNVSGLYQRWLSTEVFQPPYRFTFDLMVTARPDSVWIEGENRRPSWHWGVCFYPWASPTDPWRDNVVMVTERPTATPAATQRDRSYSTNWDVGSYRQYLFPRRQWTRCQIDVAAASEWVMSVDGQQIVRAKERIPTFAGPGRVGFRIDFYDISVRNPVVEPADSRLTCLVDGGSQ